MPRIEIRDLQIQDCVKVSNMMHSLAKLHGIDSKISSDVIIRDVCCDVPWYYISVAFDCDNILAYISYSRLVNLVLGLRGLEIIELYVDPDHRHCGIGSALVDNLKEQARATGVSYFSVVTDADNYGAQIFYQKLGFLRNRLFPNPRFSLLF